MTPESAKQYSEAAALGQRRGPRVDRSRVRIVRGFPHEVRVLKDVWIPLSDGIRVSATIWLPTSAATVPVPAILEYLPYRKDDWTIEMDSIRHPYLAGHGYAAVRVDMRGSGNSDGILEDEYLPQEQADATEVID